jgi:hypothetical protein
MSAQVSAADFSDFISVNDPTDGAARQNSLMLFGGVMSTTNLGSTLLFNTVPNFGMQPYHPHYDNDIIGLTYQRDVYRLGGLVVAGEIGVADRFGHYAECCAPIEQTIMSSGLLNSGELWFGPAIRYEALVLGNTVRVVPGFTAGFSVVTNSIGAEEGKVQRYQGDGTFLGYLGFDVAFSLVSLPAWELVIEEHHRSGADGTFGKLYEGYNANVAGLRYHF